MDVKKTLSEGVEIEVKIAEGKAVIAVSGDLAVLAPMAKKLIPGTIDDFLIDLGISVAEKLP